MSNFGKIPKGKGFGIVPKFALRRPDVRPGPKALYASLCTNASPDGLLWRSLTKLAEEFGVSIRQVQRWVNDLESAGLLVRMGWKGKTNHFLLIRDEEGVTWAQREALKNIVRRKVKKSEQTASDSSDTATSESHLCVSDDTKSTTSVSYKHDLTKHNNPTDQSARQRENRAGTSAQNRKTWGLKSLCQGERAEDVQIALNAMGNSVGWDVLADKSPERISEELYKIHGLRLTAAEIRSFLEPSI